MDKTFNIASCMRLSSREFLSDMDFTASIGASPTRSVYLAVVYYSTNSVVAATITYQLTVSMEVEFFNPFLLNA